MVANYTNKHMTFNEGQYIRHMEPTTDRMPQTPSNSVTTQKMMGVQVQADTFTPPLYCLPVKVQCSQMNCWTNSKPNLQGMKQTLV